MADNQSPQSVNATGTINIFENVYCLDCETMVLKYSKCSTQNSCLNYVKKGLKEENKENK